RRERGSRTTPSARRRQQSLRWQSCRRPKKRRRQRQRKQPRGAAERAAQLQGEGRLRAAFFLPGRSMKSTTFRLLGEHMDKRKVWREQEQRLVERWNQAEARQREAHAAIAREQPAVAGS